MDKKRSAKHGGRAAPLTQPAKLVEVAAALDQLLERARSLLAGSALADELLASLFQEIRTLPDAKPRQAAIQGIVDELGEQALPLLDMMAKDEDTSVVLPAIRALGSIKSKRAATALHVLAEKARNKEARKEARRSLYRLQSLGMAVEPLRLVLEAQIQMPKPEYRVLATYIGNIDGGGGRSGIAAVEKPYGGIAVIQVYFDDEEGIKQARVDEVARRNWQGLVEKMRLRTLPSILVELPAEYFQCLMYEAVEITAGAGRTVPLSIRPWQRILVAPQPMERLAIYEELSLLDIKWHPEYLQKSPRILTLPEFRGWVIKEELVRSYVADMRDVKEGKISLPPWVEKEKLEEILQRALATLFDTRTRRLYKRRLEENGYLLIKTGQTLEAKRALAAAQAFDELSEVPLPQNPFARALVLNSIYVASLIEEERTGEAAASRAGLVGTRPRLQDHLARSLDELEGTKNEA
ncbi:MAG: HEAT repeat domain-containing protein [Chloroflexi bacterium]|nr:HEAT repeat domain-containing protein [Chloroflexota bacterium]